VIKNETDTTDVIYHFSRLCSIFLLLVHLNIHVYTTVIAIIQIIAETLSSEKKITMMQIETIILNTSLIEVAEKSIPNELIKTYNNSTTSTKCNQGTKKLSNDTQYDNKQQQEVVAAAAAIASDVIIKKRAAPYFLFDLDSRK
jgi:hypothetical protein